jgi:hypothetical protein
MALSISVGRQIRLTQIYLGTYLDFSVGTHLGWSLYLGYLPEHFPLGIWVPRYMSCSYFQFIFYIPKFFN